MEPEIPLTWSGWKQLAITVVASILTTGGIYRLINIWLYRRKPAAEEHEITARALKTEAEADGLQVQNDKVRLDVVNEMMSTLARANESIEILRAEKTKWKELSEQKDIELKLADYQLRKMSGFITAKGLNYAEFDEPNK